MLLQENIEEEINEARERTNQRVRQFVQLSFEKEAENRVTQLKEKIENSQPRPSTSSPQKKEKDEMYVTSCNVSVGTKIKCEALLRREKYHSLDIQGKAIVSLGLNSILDLSFNFPLAQTALFNRQQWKQLQSRFPLKKYNVADYNHLLEPLSSIDFIYNEKNGHDVNWLNIYKELKKLDSKYDQNIQTEYNDLNFCIFLLLQIMSITKNQSYLFDGEINKTEWDFVVKFWGRVTERLFTGTGLRLKWDDTHLTAQDIVPYSLTKAGPMTLHKRASQVYNIGTDIGIEEIADRCKIQIKNKAAIDKFILDGCIINSVDSLRVCGLEVHFANTTLVESGLYVGSQFYSAAVDSSLHNLTKYFNLAFHLLCFRDQCISISNQYENHLINTRTNRISTKRCIDSLPSDDLITMQSYIRGSWNPPRIADSPPPQPKKLFGNDSDYC